MSEAKADESALLRSYIPKSLSHLKPRMMLKIVQMEKQFRVGGLTVSGFLGRCQREGRPIKKYRDAKGVNHYNIGEIAARAKAMNMTLSIRESEPRGSDELDYSKEKHSVLCGKASNSFTGRSLLSEREIVAKAKGSDENKVIGVYFLVYKNRVVYVGQSTNIHSRIAQHTTKDFDSWCYIPCSREALDVLESLYIYHLMPPLNGRYGGTDQVSAPLEVHEIAKLAGLAKQGASND